MKGLRDFTYATWLLLKTSYDMNPGTVFSLGVVTILFTLSIVGVI